MMIISARKCNSGGGGSCFQILRSLSKSAKASAKAFIVNFLGVSCQGTTVILSVHCWLKCHHAACDRPLKHSPAVLHWLVCFVYVCKQDAFLQAQLQSLKGMSHFGFHGQCQNLVFPSRPVDIPIKCGCQRLSTQACPYSELSDLFYLTNQISGLWYLFLSSSCLDKVTCPFQHVYYS